MPTKKVAKKKVAKKRSPTYIEYKYVGIDQYGKVYASDGPIQIFDGKCIFLSDTPNEWTDTICTAKYIVDEIRNLNNDWMGCYTDECLTWEEYLVKYPTVSKETKGKQLKFCE